MPEITPLSRLRERVARATPLVEKAIDHIKHEIACLDAPAGYERIEVEVDEVLAIIEVLDLSDRLARFLAEQEPLSLAIKFHETYERLAPSFGYETRTETRAFDPTTPNGRLMVAVCGEILDLLASVAMEGET